MLLTLSQFARLKGITPRHARRLAADSSYESISHKGETFRLVHSGTYDVNGKSHYKVVVPEIPVQRRHLADSERAELLAKIRAGGDLKRLASEYDVSFTTVYKLKRFQRSVRKRRGDAGSSPADWLPKNAIEYFKSIYLASAQRNAAYAIHLVEREMGGVKIPYRFALAMGARLNAQHTLLHQAAQFERDHTPHIERDLWAEYDFMEQVVFDCWKADLWVKHGSNQVQPRLVVAIDLKTRHVLSHKVVARDANSEDVMDVMLDLAYRWGRPGMFLLDNGTEFVNDMVQRFVHGLWTTEEHEAKTRIVFSEAYHPQSKGALERIFRICKDEFCVFSRSYSPNPVESRKPTKRLSHVKGDMTLGEFAVRFKSYLTEGVFMTRPRIMWMDPHKTRSHEDNRLRPRTMAEAMERAYSTHEKVDVAPEKLAFLYAKTFKKQIRRGMITVTYAGGKYRYIPENIPIERMTETFQILINPLDLSQAWVLDLQGEVITEASDYRLKNVAGRRIFTREWASETKKARNRVIKHTRAAATLREEIDAMAIVSRPEIAAFNPPGGDSAAELVYSEVRRAIREEEETPLSDAYLRGAFRAQEDELNQ